MFISFVHFTNRSFICSVCTHLHFHSLDHSWCFCCNATSKSWAFDCIWCVRSSEYCLFHLRTFPVIFHVFIRNEEKKKSKINWKHNRRIMDEVSLYNFCFLSYFTPSRFFRSSMIRSYTYWEKMYEKKVWKNFFLSKWKSDATVNCYFC